MLSELSFKEAEWLSVLAAQDINKDIDLEIRVMSHHRTALDKLHQRLAAEFDDV